jgi:uncharacterized protein (TIGR03066 family)
MKVLRWYVVILSYCVLPLTTFAQAVPEKKADAGKEKLVGVWEIVKSTSNAAPGTTVEFTKDAKLNISYNFQGKSVTLRGTYVVDGEKLRTTWTGPDGMAHKETLIIKMLTDKVLVTIDEKGKDDEFKKK